MLTKVLVPAGIFQLMLTHALSTENEEVCGMLVGNWKTLTSNNPFVNANTIAKIESIAFLTRSDKRKDRVEIDAEQQHAAALHAEEVSCQTGRPMCIVGWYHSHPHITVFPSHIDLHTQQGQQMLDQRFFGIILSCFHTHSDQSQRIQITCFQSGATENDSTTCVHIPLEIIPDEGKGGIRSLYTNIPQRLFEENAKEYDQACHRVQYQSDTDSELMDVRDRPSLPDTMTRLHNLSVYGQIITRLVDTMIGPQIHLLDTKSHALDAELALLAQRKIDLIKQKQDMTLIEL